jgi:hypothetical protein
MCRNKSQENVPDVADKIGGSISKKLLLMGRTWVNVNIAVCNIGKWYWEHEISHDKINQIKSMVKKYFGSKYDDCRCDEDSFQDKSLVLSVADVHFAMKQGKVPIMGCCRV